MTLAYTYDEQIRRYLQQIIRVFSHFKIHTGLDANGNDNFYRIPCAYGDQSRMAQHIIRQNTENAVMPIPFIAIYDVDMQLSPERRQLPNHVDNRQYHERNFDKEQNKYTNEPGYKYTVKRYMPVPYNLTIMVDIWYTQNEHKLQIAEQIMMLFNPMIDIQTGTNPLDWSSLTNLEMTGITWNMTGIPAGVDENIRITQFQFQVPIWINPPSIVQKQKVIEQIVADIHATSIDRTNIPIYEDNFLNIDPNLLGTIFDPSNDVQRVIVTPEFHYIRVEGNVITLLGSDQGEINNDTGTVWSWKQLFEQYKTPVIENISLLRLRPADDIENTTLDYIGRIKYHNEPNKIYWTADLETIPQDTIKSFNAIIDPQRNLPGGDLPNAAIGQRYLVTTEISEDAQSTVWSNIHIEPNDIIEYDGSVWSVVFDASESDSTQYTTNGFDGDKLQFNPETKEWTIIPDGIWKPGYWRLIL